MTTPTQFPRSARYNPDWLLASVSGAANPLILTEWLTNALDLQPNMRILDLGCGRAVSSIFLRKEFNVEVWAADLWFSPAENLQRIRDAGVDDGVFPIHANARALPFAPGFFDAILSIDSFPYYGTDDLYLAYLARFLKPGGQLGIAGAGLTTEIESVPPAHLLGWWTHELCCLHSSAWWSRHWSRTGIVEVQVADTLPDGHKLWLDWQHLVAPDNHAEIAALEADQGLYLGYVRVVARRLPNVDLPDPIESIPAQYLSKPLFRADSNF